MSVSGISSSFLAQAGPTLQNPAIQKFQEQFQQLGQDIQTGHLTAAQSDLASLQLANRRSTSPALPQTTNPLSQALDQLSQDLKAGNLVAAQKDYATAQQDLQSAAAGAHRRHHHSGGVSAAKGLVQEFAQWGQTLSGGNLSAAHQAYNLLEQDLPFTSDSAPLSASAPSVNNSLSWTA